MPGSDADMTAGSTDTTAAIHRLLVFSSPVPGREDEYNAWYNDEHLAEVCEVPGFVAAQRFRLSDDQLDDFPSTPYKYMAIYELDGPPGKPLEALLERIESGQIELPACLDVTSIQPSAFSSISERATKQS